MNTPDRHHPLLGLRLLGFPRRSFVVGVCKGCVLAAGIGLLAMVGLSQSGVRVQPALASQAPHIKYGDLLVTNLSSSGMFGQQLGGPKGTEYQFHVNGNPVLTAAFQTDFIVATGRSVSGIVNRATKSLKSATLEGPVLATMNTFNADSQAQIFKFDTKTLTVLDQSAAAFRGADFTATGGVTFTGVNSTTGQKVKLTASRGTFQLRSLTEKQVVLKESDLEAPVHLEFSGPLQAATDQSSKGGRIIGDADHCHIAFIDGEYVLTFKGHCVFSGNTDLFDGKLASETFILNLSESYQFTGFSSPDPKTKGSFLPPQSIPSPAPKGGKHP